MSAFRLIVGIYFKIEFLLQHIKCIGCNRRKSELWLSLSGFEARHAIRYLTNQMLLALDESLDNKVITCWVNFLSGVHRQVYYYVAALTRRRWYRSWKRRACDSVWSVRMCANWFMWILGAGIHFLFGVTKIIFTLPVLGFMNFCAEFESDKTWL